MKIVRNSAKCLVCGVEIISTHKHHYVECECGNIAVDGGPTPSARNIGGSQPWEDTSITYYEEPGEMSDDDLVGEEHPASSDDESRVEPLDGVTENHTQTEEQDNDDAGLNPGAEDPEEGSAGEGDIVLAGINVTAETVRSYCERIERLEDEKTDLSADISEAWKEATEAGINKPALKHVLKIKRMDSHKQRDFLVHAECYAVALGVDAQLEMDLQAEEQQANAESIAKASAPPVPPDDDDIEWHQPIVEETETLVHEDEPAVEAFGP